MSFDISTGTRGGRQPGGRLMHWINRWNIRRIRRKGGKIMGMDALVLNTLGRKTGTQRQHPVAYFSDGHDSWLIVASANGAAKNPAWFHNLAAHPDSVQIEMAGRKISVVAEQLRGTAREQAWHQIATAQERFATYEEKTDRKLPVVRLRAVSADKAEGKD